VTQGRCADLSEAAGELLAATATTARNWLLVEVRGTWPRDVGDATALDDAERAAVLSWLEDVPSSRLLFIRRPGRAGDRRLVFGVHAAERETRVRRIELNAAATLADVDLAGGGDEIDTQLVLVCGHGTRDACCALRGSAVYGALGGFLADEGLWLSSHQGGHRFAANVLVLPDGIQLGRVRSESAARIVGDALTGRLELEHYRGRTAYTSREQAAERAVRELSGLVSLADLTLAGDDGTHVRFVAADGGEYCATIEDALGSLVPASCGAEPELQAHLGARMV